MTEARTFDGSTGNLSEEPAPYAPPAYATGYDDTPAATETSSLDMLLHAVTERETEEHGEALLGVVVPGIGVRLQCRIDFGYPDWVAWQKLAIPREKRRKPQPTDLRQNVLCTLVLINTCEFLEVQDDAGNWIPVTDRTGTALAFDSSALRDQFGVMDAPSLIQKLFAGRDAYIIRAGMRVVNAAGYGDEADEREALEGDATEDEASPLP